MSITVNGTLQPDGITVELEHKVALPPGRVTVEVRRANTAPGPTMLEVLDRIHQEQRGRGRPPMTDEQMASEIDQMREDDEEYEARWRLIWSQSKPGAPADTSDADLPG
jgi:hypothetical protein